MRVEAHTERSIEHPHPRARVQRRSAEALFQSRSEGVGVFEEAAHEHRLVAHVSFQRTQELAFEQTREFQAGHRHQDDDGIDEQ
jgi:hypothetical protein